VKSFGFRLSAISFWLSEVSNVFVNCRIADRRKPTAQHQTLFPITSMNNDLQNSSNHFVLVNQKQKTFIPVENIIMLEGQSNYSVFHLKYGKKRIYAHTIRYYEDQLLDQQFIRVHSGFLINPSFVVEYNRVDGKLMMENNLEASISRRKRKNLKEFSSKCILN
jgi:DNA-binding LytR/AlgR family response regulator